MTRFCWKRGSTTTFRLELPLRDDPLARELRAQAAKVGAQALQAIQDLRRLHRLTEAERSARRQAEARRLRAIENLRAEHGHEVARPMRG